MCQPYIFATHPQSACLYTILLGLSKSTTHTKNTACKHLQAGILYLSLWIQGGAARNMIWPLLNCKRLNPFEVREVLQVYRNLCNINQMCLNPFEVREVLQVTSKRNMSWIPVSIPLKSGRCCKSVVRQRKRGYMSQSLWSQGGAASSQA